MIPLFENKNLKKLVFSAEGILTGKKPKVVKAPHVMWKADACMQSKI